jgi:hypothetical protein
LPFFLQTTCSFIAVNPPLDVNGDQDPKLRPYNGSCKITAVAKCCKQACKHKLKHHQQPHHGYGGYGGYQQYAGYKNVGTEKKKVKKQKVVSAPVPSKKKVQTRKAYMGPADSP